MTLAFEEALRCISLPANADLSTKQYFFVKVTNSSGTGRAAVAGDGEHAIGVLQNKPDAANEVATIAISGVSKVSAGGTITAGQPVASDAAGEAVAAATGDIILGTALLSADDGDLVPVLLDARNDLSNNNV